MLLKKLSLFGNNKNEPGFFKRGFALCLDFILILIITTPTSNLIMKIMYQNELPVEFFYKNLPLIVDQSKNISDIINDILQNDKVREYLTKEKVVIKILIDQFVQLSIFITYFLYFWYKFQTTPGKMLFKLKIVDNSTLSKPTVSQLILRIAGFILSILLLGSGFLICLFNKEKRCLHDFISRTKVIYIK